MSARRRVIALDVLRGLAIIGTLASNIWVFTDLAAVDTSSNVGPLEDFAEWLPNGKFIGLLTIMFGIGLEIQRQSALRAGEKWPGKYPWRAGLLFLDGLINYIFVVQFDVLRAYAVTGLLVAFLLLTSQRVQWWLIALFVSAHIAFTLWSASPLSDRFIQDLGLQGFTKMNYTDSGGTWWENTLTTMGDMSSAFGFGSEFPIIIVMGLGVFLIGANLYRVGVFTETRRALRYSLIAAGAIALPLDYYLANISEDFFDFARYGASVIVALGILAAVAEFYVRRPQLGRTGRVLSSIGRMALSGYLLQNILGVICQYTVFRLPFFDQIGAFWTATLGFVTITAILIVFSSLWLRRFPRGPMETVMDWAYRKLSRTPNA
ncbi:DUF418 domain-containing protein [Micrococcus sp. CH7]|nr:DUF418 domain-containing protein [Micrococcus sp. CH7]KYK06523.1 hypothetical protein AUV08_05850 [Micrococcus sp. CH7]RUQ24225.1 DUF418 domain-containing protein [Micrococcus sp. HSID17245]